MNFHQAMASHWRHMLSCGYVVWPWEAEKATRFDGMEALAAMGRIDRKCKEQWG